MGFVIFLLVIVKVGYFLLFLASWILSDLWVLTCFLKQSFSKISMNSSLDEEHQKVKVSVFKLGFGQFPLFHGQFMSWIFQGQNLPKL